MAEKMAEEEAWRYEHPTDHPDNKPPVTTVAESSEEAVKDYETAVNAELEKGRHETEDTTPVLEPLKVQLVDPDKERKKEGNKESVDYEAKTVDELKDLARERGIDVAWDSRKADLVKALEKHDKAK